MSEHITLSSEIRKDVEARIKHTLAGIEDTLNLIEETHHITPRELKTNLKNLEGSFYILSQKWSLEILYTLFLTNKQVRFNELKRVLGVNSRTLTDKLKTLQEHNYIIRKVSLDPTLKVEYSLSEKGRNTILLALPLLYYSISI